MGGEVKMRQLVSVWGKDGVLRGRISKKFCQERGASEKEEKKAARVTGRRKKGKVVD